MPPHWRTLCPINQAILSDPDVACLVSLQNYGFNVCPYELTYLHWLETLRDSHGVKKTVCKECCISTFLNQCVYGHLVRMLCAGRRREKNILSQPLLCSCLPQVTHLSKRSAPGGVVDIVFLTKETMAFDGNRRVNPPLLNTKHEVVKNNNSRPDFAVRPTRVLKHLAGMLRGGSCSNLRPRMSPLNFDWRILPRNSIGHRL